MSGRWSRFREKFSRKSQEVTPPKTWKQQPVGTKVTKEFAAPRVGVPNFRRRNLQRADHFVGRGDRVNAATRRRTNKRRAKNKMRRKTHQRARNMNRTVSH